MSAQFNGNLENTHNPFVATVFIQGKQYGVGESSSKKQSKQLAAEQTLDVLCPGTYNKEDKEPEAKKPIDLNVPIEDERLLELDGKDKTPVQVLDEYRAWYGVPVVYNVQELREDGVELYKVTVEVESRKQVVIF